MLTQSNLLRRLMICATTVALIGLASCVKKADSPMKSDHVDDAGYRKTYEYTLDSEGNRVLNGTLTVYFPNGQKYHEENWQEDRLHGPLHVWDSNGRLVRTCTFENGLEQGKAEEWNVDSRTHVEMWYENGYLHGPRMVHRDDGTLVYMSTYFRGRLHGSEIHMYPESGVVQIDSYINGALISQGDPIPLASIIPPERD